MRATLVVSMLFLTACDADSIRAEPGAKSTRDASSEASSGTGDAQAARDSAVAPADASAADAAAKDGSSAAPDAAGDVDAGKDASASDHVSLDCTMAFDPGPCTSSIPVFRYDGATNTCVADTYGGCGGNDNRFANKAACDEACTCPPGLGAAGVCKTCGAAGGCGEVSAECVPLCDTKADCEAFAGPYQHLCSDGRCNLIRCL